MSKKLCAALAVLFLLLGCALPVFAAPDLPQDKTTLQAKLAYSGQPLAGVEVTLHRVADISETSPWITFTLCGDFANYPVDLLELTDKEWADAASTLANYALADSLAPIATATTDQNGLVDFANLDSGLYLLQAAQTTDQAGWRYFPAPSLLVLPAYDTAQGQWNTQAQAVLKVERKAKILFEHGPVKRADHGYVKACRLFKESLYLSAVLSDYAYEIPAGLIIPGL